VNASLYFSGIEIFKRVDDEEGVELARIVNASEFHDRLKPFDDTQTWVVDGLNGNDELIGGKAADDIQGSNGNDSIDGGENSIADSDEFIENLDGGDGNDQITYRGFDTSFQTAPSSIIANINGGSGNDLIAVNLDLLSRVNLDGGEGIDMLALQTPAGMSSLWQSNFLDWSWMYQDNQYLLTAQYISKPEAGVFEVSSTFEKIAIGLSGAGQSYNIIRPQDEARLTMTGTQAADFILAVQSDVKINAGDGNDIVLAKHGSLVSLGAGINELHGTDADFTFSYEWSSIGVRVDLASQLGLVFDGDGDLLALDRINITPDILIGSNNADTLMGSAQDNTMYGGQGDDVIISAGGNDLIFGGDGNETITINGEGQSVAEGGVGADTFILDFNFSAQNTLTINDLEFTEGDRVSINLNALSQQPNYGSYQVVDTSGSLIFGHEISPDAQAVLNLVLDQDAGILSFDDGLSQTDFMFVNDGFEGLSAAQLVTLINIDYF
jgi:Ca2+-binding RTX toxin-like protein